jgi:alpha-methylacyl-CoA racemase
MAAIGPVPHCGMVLADMGAEILRIDRPAGADLGIPVDRRFDVFERGKTVLPLDLKRPEAVAQALDMISGADALIEGFRPGVMERLGLGPEACLASNARLVYGRISGWGDRGPLAEMAGHDLNFVGLTGALAAMGAPDAPPPPPLNLVADFGGGAMQLVAGILAALLHARTTGQGQVVTTSIYAGAQALTAFFYGLRAAGKWQDVRGANLLDGAAPYYRCYETADRLFVAVAAIEPKFYRALLAGLGLGADAAGQNDRAAWRQTETLFAERFRQRTRAQWAEKFAGSDACVTPVLDWEEAKTHPQAIALGLFESPGGIAQPRSAPSFSATPARSLQR